MAKSAKQHLEDEKDQLISSIPFSLMCTLFRIKKKKKCVITSTSVNNCLITAV